MMTRRQFLELGGCALLAPRAFAEVPVHQTRKKGLAGAAPLKSGLQTSWYYNWGTRPSEKGIPAANPQITFYPMCWGWSPKSPAALGNLRAERPPLLFGFNEPDHTDQSNLTVEAALAAWPQLEDISIELVSPSCAQPHQTWMQTFMAQAEQRKLRVDSIGFHHYGPPEPEDFIGLLERVHTMYGRPIWVTEFAAADWRAKTGGPKNRYTSDQVVRFIQTVCPYMESQPWVRGYAWYPWGDQTNDQALIPCEFFGPDGALTPPGQAYAAVTGEKSSSDS
jgi:hypothetical protein